MTIIAHTHKKKLLMGIKVELMVQYKESTVQCMYKK